MNERLIKICGGTKVRIKASNQRKWREGIIIDEGVWVPSDCVTYNFIQVYKLDEGCARGYTTGPYTFTITTLD